MAVDTRNRRASALLDGITYPNPDGSLAFAGDRQHMAETFAFTSASTGGGGSGSSGGLISSNQSRWVIPHRNDAIMVVQATADAFIITTR